MSIPVTDQITELAREKVLRQRLYPQWVERRSLRQEAADLQIARLDAAINSLKRLDNISKALTKIRDCAKDAEVNMQDALDEIYDLAADAIGEIKA